MVDHAGGRATSALASTTGPKFSPHGQAANVLFRLQDHDTGGAFRSARNQTLPTLAGFNGKPWLNNHVRGK